MTKRTVIGIAIGVGIVALSSPVWSAEVREFGYDMFRQIADSYLIMYVDKLTLDYICF
ncbi:MAG: hypothetical protein QF654_00900 [Alphaproteobacteria bacterium]|jgi:hypothetical protein|nr:hypothetical protein [Alphaproteobacteria bacterium]|tara:strand:+ start:278 stop:451 length:174 start_codon:yes stop_codon:yes gene_type:complete